MSNQELIDKAVEQFCGKWPATYIDNDYMGYRPEIKNTTYYPFYLFDYKPNNVDFWHIEEFQQRAKELGWCNGYKYGVEYPTNGKKPDLPDDVLVEVKFNHADTIWHKDSAGEWRWIVGGIVRFRIVDERYKPVEQTETKTSSTSDWYDYEQQKAIALPPVGTECLTWDDGKECW